jgi:hypothetical protein
MALNDRVGMFTFNGHDGTQMCQSAILFARATENWSSTARGTKFEFYTVPNGTTAITLALALEQNQQATFAGDISISDAKNIIVGSTTGTKIGTATTQKLGFYNATPIVQPTTSVGAATFVANTGTAINTGSTFDGYTLQKVVAALRKLGLLA